MEERVLSLPQKTRLIKSLPSAIRSCVEDGGWQIVMPRNTSSCTIMTEEEFVNKYARNGFCQTNKEIESNMSSHLNRFGLDHDDPNTFMSLLNPEVAEKLREHLSEQLVKDGKQPVRTIAELYEVIATFLIRSRFRLSTPVAYKQFLLPLEKSENITLTSQSRFVDIIPRIRGYDVSGRSGDDTLEDTWMQDKNRLRNLEELEEKMFAPSIKLIMNKRSGELVLDDELIGSRSNDVECKTLSYRKAGKEGPVVDAIADSHLGCILGMRLHVKGETELSNIMSLVNRFPTLLSSNHNVSIKFDRGYGKMKMLHTVGLKGYRMTTVASTVGSNHPFITSKEANDYIEKMESKRDKDKNLKLGMFKNFVLDGSPTAGAQVTYAKKDIDLRESDGATCTVYAFAIRDVFDKKEAVKDIRFFNTGGSINDHTANLWIAIRKTDIGINGNHLFSERMTSPARKMAEDILSNSCGPLTVGQRTGDWFLLRRFHFTGMTFSFIYSNNKNHPPLFLNMCCNLSQELLERLWMKHLYPQMN